MNSVFRAVMVCIILAVCGGAWGQYPSPDLQGPIDVDQALEIAFQYSPRIRLSLDQIQRAKGGVREARANFMPKFNGELNHVRQGPTIAFADPLTGASTTLTRDHNTTAQAAQRTEMTSAVSAWQGLYQSEVDNWNAAARSVYPPISGVNYFVKEYIAQAGAPTIPAIAPKKNLTLQT